MKIKRFEGASEQEVIERVKNELGLEAIIVSIRTIRARGLFGAFKKNRVEVTAAYEAPGELLSENAELPASPVKDSPQAKRAAAARQKPANENGGGGYSEAETAAALQDNRAFAAEIKEIYKEKVMEEQAEKIKLLEKNVITAQEMLSRMSRKLAVEQHKPDSGGRRYNNNIIQVFFDSMLEQGVTENTAAAVLDGLDIDYAFETEEDENSEKIDINIIVKMVYSNIISIIGCPQLPGLEQDEPLSAAGSILGEALPEDKSGGNLPHRQKSGKKKTPKKREPFIAAFIGPTGVGKTTTIAKLSADFMINKNLPVSLISADTYRIAAVEQLKTYADILNIDLGVVYNPGDLAENLETMRKTKDVILIDTAGRSHKNGHNMEELKLLLDAAKGCHKYLVLSLATKFEDMLDIVETYSGITDFNIVFTKLDETKTLGSVLNLSYATGKRVSYITFGQNVPDDIRALQPEEVARAILCGL